jgi:hypothetical protein
MSAWARWSATVRLCLGIALVALTAGILIGAEPEPPVTLHQVDPHAKAGGVVTWA